MSNEVFHNYLTSNTLYFCVFQLDGNVFLSNGLSDEVWGAGGNDADDYDVGMDESTVGSSGHYVGDFDDLGNISAGTYRVAIYQQAGASPADTDSVVAEAEIHWDGTAEITQFTLDTDLTDIKGTGFVKDTDSLVDLFHAGADGDTGKILSDQMDTIITNQELVVNVFDERT